ncbi:amidohydrolase family protein [Microbacterium sp. NPDC058389]|uniref:amidohydrolase family protein n=1 Tax=Microbacterium sp. NPDC058389 TaxID=3346475 RepID=UPI003664DE2F
MTIVDAHIHLWDLSRFSLSWFRDGLDLPRVASAADFRAVAETRPVTAAIAVQAGDTLAEMQWLQQVAAIDPVVGSVVLQYVPEREGWAGLATAVLNDRVRGIRVATPGGAADLSDVPGLDALCEGAAVSGRVVELLVRPEQLDAVALVAARHPRTTFVLCHLGLGAADPSPEWEDSLRRVAAEANTAAKFSGLATAAGAAGRLHTLAATALDAFGADRLMFGSDWPMSARVDGYPRLVDQVERAWGSRSDRFWGAVVRQLYGM